MRSLRIFCFKYIFFSFPLFHFIFTISSGVFQLSRPILSDFFLIITLVCLTYYLPVLTSFPWRLYIVVRSVPINKSFTLPT